MAKLFGFSIDDGDKKPKGVVSPVPQNNEDGVDYYLSSGFYGQYVDIEGVFKSEHDLMRRYREMALHPEVDNAIEDVVNEAIVSDLNDSPVEIELSNLNASEPLKKIIREEFKYIKDLLQFDKKCHEIFRNWYVDGRVYYHKVIDLDKPSEGIKEVRHMDAMKVKYMRVLKKEKGTDLQIAQNYVPGRNNTISLKDPEIDEFFAFSPDKKSIHSNAQKTIKIAPDAVTYITSGLVDRNKHLTLSYLHKAIKGLNQLRMIEDALVIYRLSRAPERRIFYIDVGNLPKVKSEQYLRDVMNRYRNKLVYDANTGEIRDDRKHMSMLEDFWLPRREGGRGTEISTLPGGQNLGELADIEYFQKKLYRALNVPESRIAGSGDGFNLGRTAEIQRDELKFNKFVGRLRKRFSNVFLDLLKTQLILKNVVTPEDWEVLAEHIQFDYLKDNHFSELKENEMITSRVTLASQVEPYLGKYYSVEYVRRHVLRQTDEEIREIDKQIEAETEAGLILSPEDQMAAEMGMMPGEEGGAPAEGGAPQDPKSVIDPADQKRGEF